MLNSFHSDERRFIGGFGEKEWAEYKRFAFRDDMLKLTVGVVLGSAFNKVVNSLSDNLMMPFLSFLTLNTGEAWRAWSWTPREGLDIRLGRVFGDILDFVLISFVLYLVYVKIVGKLRGGGPTGNAKRCSLCLESVNPAAVRCKFCGGNPNGFDGGDGGEDKGSENCGGKQERPGRPGGEDRNGVKGSGKSDSGTNRRRRPPGSRGKR